MKDAMTIIKALHREAAVLIETIEELERDKEFLFTRKMEEEKKARALSLKLDELTHALADSDAACCAWRAKAEGGQ